MKISIIGFKGEAPIFSNRLLPEGMASKAVNANMVSGDLGSFFDIGNLFQLAKAAIINTIWLIAGPPPDFWLQWSQSEVAYGTNIDVALGTIPGDSTYRTYMTGLSGGPRQTNLFYATDPSQKGSNPAGAYPYVTFPVGIEDPTDTPVASVGASTVFSNVYQYAAEASVNNVLVDPAHQGLDYVVGDVVALAGTPSLGMPEATVTVTGVDPTTGAVTGVSVTTGGFYDTGGAPTAPNVPTGGSGTGLQFNTVNSVANSLAGFTVFETDNGAGFFSRWTLSSNQWEVSFAQGDLTSANSQADFGLKTAQTVKFQADLRASNSGGDIADMVMYLAGTYEGYRYPLGPAISLSVTDSLLSLYSAVVGDSQATNNMAAMGSTVVATQAYAFSASPTTYRVFVTMTQNTASAIPGYTIDISVADATAPGINLVQILGAFIPYNGEGLGVGGNHRSSSNAGEDVFFKNLMITVTPQSSGAASIETSFVTTFETQYGTGTNAIYQESGPSDPSNTVTYNLITNPTTGVVTITPMTVQIDQPPSALDIVAVNLYRLPQNGTQYAFDTQLAWLGLSSVAGIAVGHTLEDPSGLTGVVLQISGSNVLLSGEDVPTTVGEVLTDQTTSATATITANVLAPITFVDTNLDAALGDPLASATWAPPPANLQGIKAGPNGVMYGFFGTTFCACAPGFPFAWSVGNQYPTDYPIVEYQIKDQTAFILTQAHPYTAWGPDPSSLQMTKETANQGCTSKPSVATHKVFGIIYSSGNGPCYYRGQGDLDLLRMPNGDPWFSIEQWQALNPKSIYGIVHNDQYWFWYNNGTKKGGYVLDLSPAGFGLIELDFHVTAAFVDPATDILYFCADSSTYPIDGDIIAAPQNEVCQWEGAATLRTRTWERDEIVLQRPACFGYARVQAEDFDNLMLTVACENGTAYNGPVDGPYPFVMEPIVGRRWSIALTGTSQVNTAEIAESVDELVPA